MSQRHDSAAYELRLLGGFQLRRNGCDVDTLPSTERVLAFLALNDRLLPRAYVAESLWPDTTDGKAAANLRTALWRLHDAGHDIVEASSSRMRLRATLWSDVRLVETAARRHHACGEVPDAGLLDEARGELLPGCWDSWLVFERERLRMELIHLFESIGHDALARGDDFTAARAGLAAVVCDPLRESANALLIAAHLAAADRAEAERVYCRYEQHLQSELGIAPSVDTRRRLLGTGSPEPAVATTRSSRA